MATASSRGGVAVATNGRTTIRHDRANARQAWRARPQDVKQTPRCGLANWLTNDRASFNHLPPASLARRRGGQGEGDGGTGRGGSGGAPESWTHPRNPDHTLHRHNTTQHTTQHNTRKSTMCANLENHLGQLAKVGLAELA